MQALEVVITVFLHTAGPQFKPGQVQIFECIVGVMILYFVRSILQNIILFKNRRSLESGMVF